MKEIFHNDLQTLKDMSPYIFCGVLIVCAYVLILKAIYKIKDIKKAQDAKNYRKPKGKEYGKSN